ncbi:18261_t:CDS:1 [Cetraspora pellucida]|uniref:18261_t:CDS:1 n=1 Tax=Cetraspora pellucida TaxID=1433469 RepID=A0ACA9PKB7_9GLOM|nr:18261_t:CDS:1 [Cetraspora pellucida]
MVTANDRIEGLCSTPEYRQEFYVEGTLLMCCACRISLNHKKKSVLDDHLGSTKHEVTKNAMDNSVDVQPNTHITRLSEREQLNLDLVQALTTADIPLEKFR